jgi:hypothetical protein
MSANIHTTIQKQARDDSGDEWSGLGQLDPVAMAAAGAVVGALFLVILTAGLLLQEPSPGQGVGANLRVLGSYLPGYEVSWLGTCISAFYGSAAGMVAGFVIAFLWNVFHLLIIRWLLLQRLISRI